MKCYDHIPDFLARWIAQQKTFWVATAPLGGDGLINLSPKGSEGTFHVVNPNRVWYEDLTGSGVETIAHVRENGRITILFNAFEGPPRISRLYGRGTVYEFGTPEYDALIPPEKRQAGSRAVIMIDVFKATTSCGFSVPLYAYRGERSLLSVIITGKEALDIEAEKDLDQSCSAPPRPKLGLKDYWTENNLKSQNGLPGLLFAPESMSTFHTSKTDFQTPTAKPAEKVQGPLLEMDRKMGVGFLVGVVVSVSFMKFARPS